MSTGSLRLGMMDFIRNDATDGQIDLAFTGANASRDVGYYNAMSGDLGAPSRMSGAGDAALKSAIADGKGGMMVPELVDHFAEVLGK